MGDKEFYKITEIAKMLDVQYLTVYNWIKQGKVKAVKLNKIYRVSKEELNKILKQGISS